MNVTEMKESDLDIVVELEKQCFKQPWNKEQCLYELQENPFSTGYLLKEDDHIVGYAFLWITFEIAQLARIVLILPVAIKAVGHILWMLYVSRQEKRKASFFH